MRQNEVRTTKHNHTPSSKAGQPSRHRCNQIPRGRYQRKNWARAPHGTNRGGRGSNIRQGGEPTTAKKQDRNNGAQPYTERSATETEKHQKTHRQKHQTETPRAQKGEARKGSKNQTKDKGRQREHDPSRTAQEKDLQIRGATRGRTLPKQKGPHTTAASGSKICWGAQRKRAKKQRQTT